LQLSAALSRANPKHVTNFLNQPGEH
jgi:hypothetical protein